MKRHKLYALWTAFLLFGLLIVGCDDNMYEAKEVGVESITLNPELTNGISLEEGQTMNISKKVSLTPVDATDRAENYYSSDPEIATVSGAGIVSANTPGTCEIVILVGGKSTSFALTVTEIVKIPFENITFTADEKTMKVGEVFDLSILLVVSPLEGANDRLQYSSSDESVVRVSEEGTLESIQLGTATITVSSKYNPSLKDEIVIKVNAYDYARDNWSMTASHELPIANENPEKNSLRAAFDGDLSTNFCLVRPTKTYGTTSKVSVPSGAAIHFTVDMKEPAEVNFFRIRHRNTTQAFLRWQGFDQILGSNDGENFTVIATNVTVTNATVESEQESPNIQIPTSTYRYLRFYAKEARCFYQSSHSSSGNTTQIQELYLGRMIP